ncbi:MAG: hypothetical protein QOG01_1424 [Pseudonocardiales bacterium]|nr:hypothetical protein [Pseudonocardiales bacterium]
MDAVLHGIEALPGVGRYAVTFRRADGSEQTAVVHVTASGVEVAEASLPTGWSHSSEVFRAVANAVLAVDAARKCASTVALRDVDGGWDVSLGNVVVGAGGTPVCSAHGEMKDVDGVYVCNDCEARAVFG